MILRGRIYLGALALFICVLTINAGKGGSGDKSPSSSPSRRSGSLSPSKRGGTASPSRGGAVSPSRGGAVSPSRGGHLKCNSLRKESFITRGKGLQGFLQKYNPIDSSQLMKVDVPPLVSKALCNWDEVSGKHPDMNANCAKECSNLAAATDNLITLHPDNNSLQYACAGLNKGECEILWQVGTKNQLVCKCYKEVWDKTTEKVQRIEQIASICRYKLTAAGFAGNVEILGSQALRGIKGLGRRVKGKSPPRRRRSKTWDSDDDLRSDSVTV